jgi:predicted secreted hydrolase
MMNRRLALRRVAGTGLWMAAAQGGLVRAQAAPPARGVQAGRALVFPADFGAHPETGIEWWYATGVLHSPQPTPETFGFQVTFFRSRTALAPSPSRFSPQQLLFAHAAVTDLAQRRLRHDQRIARQGFERAQAREGDTGLRIDRWHLRRDGPASQSVYEARVDSELAEFELALTMRATQPLVLQGQAGFSRKGPRPTQASHYYSQPQLAVAGTLTLAGRRLAVEGRAWLDHEWSDSLLDGGAVGWDWIGINLADGGALTAFRLRRADGSALWAGGSFRPAGGALRDFGAEEVRFTPERHWQSPRSQARYPVACRVQTPVGSFTVRALLDDQELDSRKSSGAIYWEGLSECLDDAGRVVGQGYLEMTGYAQALRL